MRDARPVKDVVREEGVAAAVQKKHVASLLFTYRCTLSCKHCLFNCSPSKPAVCTGLEDAVDYLRQLHELDRVVHIAGGEAMMFYPQLLEICSQAYREGVPPHFIETNATFAVADELVWRRLTEFQALGVLGLLISADPYHQRHCPPDRYVRCRRIARGVFGERNVMTTTACDDDIAEMQAIGRNSDRLADYSRRHPPMLVGRAGDELSRFFPDRPIAELTDSTWHGGGGTADCRQEFDPDTMWEIHVDPYGNVQTCCGIVVANVREVRLPDLVRRGFLGSSPIVDAVYHGGPAALLSLAKSKGYRPRDGYPQRCGMCWEIRRFLRSHYPDTLGPDEVYTRDKSV